MGVYYYAINKQNKTFYQLGKGGWYMLTDMQAFQDPEYLCNEILVECYNMDEPGCGINLTQTRTDEIINHVKTRIAPELFEMMKDTPPDQIKIINDCGDDLTICKVKHYKCIGTRYFELDSDEYKEYMKSMNYHLDDTPINKRWYNPEDYKKYKQFEEY